MARFVNANVGQKLYTKSYPADKLQKALSFFFPSSSWATTLTDPKKKGLQWKVPFRPSFPPSRRPQSAEHVGRSIEQRGAKLKKKQRPF